LVLRANAVIPERVLETTPVDEELRRFDVHTRVRHPRADFGPFSGLNAI